MIAAWRASMAFDSRHAPRRDSLSDAGAGRPRRHRGADAPCAAAATTASAGSRTGRCSRIERPRASIGRCPMPSSTPSASFLDAGASAPKVSAQPAVLARRRGATARGAKAARRPRRSSSVKPLTISRPPGAIAEISVAAARRSSAPVRLPSTTSAAGRASASRLPARDRDAAGGSAFSADVGGRRRRARRGRRRCRWTARRRAAPPQSPARRSRCRRRRPTGRRAATRCSAAQAQPRRFVVAGAEAHRRLDDHDQRAAPSAAGLARQRRGASRSHGGVTTIRPTRIAVSDACERSAQASSSTSIAAPIAPGHSGARGQRLPRRSSRAVVGGEEDAPGQRVVAGGSSSVRRWARSRRARPANSAGAIGPDRSGRASRPDVRRRVRPVRRRTSSAGQRVHPKMSLTRSKNGFSPVVALGLLDVGRQQPASSSISLALFLGELASARRRRTVTNRSPWPRPETFGHALAA